MAREPCAEAKPPNHEKFEAALSEAVDEGLMILGESCRASIWYYLKRDFSIERNEAQRKIEDFCLAIRKIFGSGGPVIEKLILRRLCDKLNLDYQDVKDSTLQIAVEKIQERRARPM